MKKRNEYKIKISFDGVVKDLLQFNVDIPYKGGGKYTDLVKIYSNRIELEISRKNNIDFDLVFYQHNSGVYSQIIKVLTFYYANNFSRNPSITKIHIYKRDQNNKYTELKKLTKKEITQPIKNKILYSDKFNDLTIIFEESYKGKAILNCLIYWLTAMSSSEPLVRFEKLYRVFNSLFSIFSPNGTEHDRLKKLREFTVDQSNHSVFQFTNRIVIDKYKNVAALRDSFQWMAMIKNNHNNPTLNSLRDMVLRYSDQTVIKLLQEIIKCKDKSLANQPSLQREINNHITVQISANTNKNTEIISITCIMYMSYIRNKIFHGEKFDLTFRIIESNKSIAELERLNELLSNYIVDLINSANKFPASPN